LDSINVKPSQLRPISASTNPAPMPYRTPGRRWTRIARALVAMAKGDAGMSDTKKAAFAVWSAFASRNADKIREVLTEDVKWIAPVGNATQVALGLPSDFLETREGIVAFLVQHFRRLFPEGGKFEFTNVVAEGNTVIFEQRMTAETINGRCYDNRYCWIFEMDGKRVHRIREYMDTYAGYRMIFADDAPRALVHQ
jgi:ketosteroid isomerase-like protein